MKASEVSRVKIKYKRSPSSRVGMRRWFVDLRDISRPLISEFRENLHSGIFDYLMKPKKRGPL